MAAPARLVGVNGCKGAWLVAESDAKLRMLKFSIADDLTDLFQRALKRDLLIAIDMPIGLSEDSQRACDRAARKFLGPRRGSSVFSAPVRPAIAAETYEEAKRLNQDACGKMLSRQAYGILPKIRQIDKLVTAGHQDSIREVHPEVSFAMLSGDETGLAAGKKSDEGVTQRLALLAGIALRPEIEQVRSHLGKGKVAVDDVLDATACLASAYRIFRGRERVFPSDAIEYDARGLRMEIVA